MKVDVDFCSLMVAGTVGYKGSTRTNDVDWTDACAADFKDFVTSLLYLLLPLLTRTRCYSNRILPYVTITFESVYSEESE